ncbi:hypothetical protein SLS62_009905 [Diatrype stigma]|uniref:Peptidase M20 dimerisation domain-containing protein n=1 Tax=Diatrype stigma TaxID=117547 RepID=A0AAN9UCD8_9PEZI
MTKKEPLLPAGGTEPQQAQEKPYWKFLAKLAITIGFLNLIWRQVDFGIWKHHEASMLAQCSQVDPLFPSQDSPSLVEMDKFLASTKFRNESIARVSGVVQVPSQSYDDLGPVGEDRRWDTMYGVAAYLEKAFPLVHSTLQLEKVNTHGLLYTWEGSDKLLKPTVLMAHQDVVPVAEATVGQWTYPPFDGHYDGEFIWGRGASDDKTNLISILEAVELLVDAGFTPQRTLVISFGFDEEISGRQGAGRLAQVLIDRYGKDGAAIIVDEGAGVSKAWGSSFATPGVAEKGYIDVEITVRMPGGHSSIPPPHNGIGVTSELVTLIEANPHEPRLHAENPYLGLLKCGAAHSPEFPSKLRKLLPSHRDTTCHQKDKLALEAAKGGAEIKYLFTTSLAPDVIHGGVKNNALPERTTVLVNHRVNVGEHSSDVKARITGLAEIIAKKYDLTVHAFNNETETPRSITLSASADTLEPAPVTPTSVEGVTPYSILSGTTRALYGPDLLVAPGLSTGNTDTRYYWDLTQHIFRFDPGWDPEREGLGNIHTVDEKLSVVAHIKATQWYSLFIRNMDQSSVA